MANDPTSSYQDWAVKAAPYLVPGGVFLSPLTAIYDAIKGSGAPAAAAPKPPAEESGIQIGTEKDYGPNIGTKVYTGPRYGYQTIDTAQTMSPEKIGLDPTDQAEFRRVQQVLRERFAPPAKPVDKRPVDVDKRTTETPTQTGVQGQGGAQQKTDPQTDKYQDLLIKLISDKKLRAEFAEEDLQNFVKRALLTEALGARSRRELTKREVELRNIDAWKELERTRLQTNAQQAIAFGSAVASSLVPNQGLGQVLNSAYASAMTPFSTFTLK